MIQRYVVDTQNYIQIINFEKHQAPHYKEQESTIPAPNDKPKNLGFSIQSSTQEPEALALKSEVDRPQNPSDSLIPDSLQSDSLIPEEIVEEGDSKTTTPPAKNNQTKKFPMFADWEPSSSFESLCVIAGLRLGEDMPINALMEFKSYWVVHPGKERTQGEWEHAFIKNLKAEKLRGGK
jgi:hypothetical protein